MQLSPSSIVRRQDNGYAKDYEGVFPRYPNRISLTVPASGEIIVTPEKAGSIVLEVLSAASLGSVTVDSGGIKKRAITSTAGVRLVIQILKARDDIVRVYYERIIGSSWSANFYPSRGDIF